jgi:DNA polymerase-4
MTLRCLFVDFNSYFASVEQYDDARLLGRPVGVVPVMAATTCCIAASYEAKAFGVKTGTLVREARRLCPDIVLIQARPARYIELHHLLMAAIEDCIHHEQPLSIDEVPCKLMGRERQRENAEAIARRIKLTLIERSFSPAIRCSIGIAPNTFLAKTASDMWKPDGLTVIERDALPQALHALELRDLCGIGASMERRLHDAGIVSVAQLCAASPRQLRAAWGSIDGERYAALLRGIDVPDKPTRRGSVGHSHVLGPELRSLPGARSVLFKLLAKAAMRLRKLEYLAGGMQVRVRFVGREERFERALAFAPIDDTGNLLHLLGAALAPWQAPQRGECWQDSAHPPLSVAVTLTELQQRQSTTPSLFDDNRNANALSGVLDRINRRYGNNKVYFGAMQAALEADAAPMRIPFGQIPETTLEEDVTGHDLWMQAERNFKRIAEAAHREGAEQRH